MVEGRRVCSLHFLPSAYKEQSWAQQQLPESFRRLPRLKKDAVPTEYLALDISDENRRVQDERDTNIVLTHSETQSSRSPEESQQENLNEQSQKLILLLQQVEELKKTNEQLREANERLMQKVITTDKQLKEKDKIIEKIDKLLGKKDCLHKKLGVQERRISKAESKKMKYQRILQSVFTPGQLKILSNENLKKTTWCSEDIASAISLRSISPKAYRFVRNSMKIPLPAMTTLRNWARKFDVMPDILNDVLAIMKNKAGSLTELEKLTVLTFDEVYISNDVAINRKDEEVIGPHKTC
ncbi:synaptonemal complex protein 1-like [Temnothorax curvispinosus]|uniref:Synaptonemal complex protein 1-like n=1 Tax=Temnothorax curvispinosus TaxID=300111 RepID=A0A6J1QPS6_9HYME|nr:synaptonemal complex protein 1-like [Temnothorax curvispinosus]XP_024893897.1 synaptonemal complex protein 1-like [Temnothorax curvispinosus]